MENNDGRQVLIAALIIGICLLVGTDRGRLLHWPGTARFKSMRARYRQRFGGNRSQSR